MRVRFEPLSGQDSVALVDLGGIVFNAGDELDVDDTKFVRGTQSGDFKSDADIVLSNPNFVEASTGKNPRFACAECGKLNLELKIGPNGVEPSEAHSACASKASPSPEVPNASVSAATAASKPAAASTSAQTEAKTSESVSGDSSVSASVGV